MNKSTIVYPELPPPHTWEDTCNTVHMWTQIAGKIRLSLSPWINHSWGSTLYVTTRGLGTSPIPYGGKVFEIDFDFQDHLLKVSVSDGNIGTFNLGQMSVAEFYEKIIDTLDELGIQVNILARPVEVVEAIPFAEDHKHKSYDPEAINLFWQSLVHTDRVFKKFRSRYLGKTSPVHFFWGAFDLAVTRFSGRTAPKHPGGAPNCADWVMEEAYSHEVSSAGFWSGAGLGEAAYYSYAYPEPDGYREFPVKPEGAYYHDTLREFILPYECVRRSSDPDGELLLFLQSTYEACAELADWDRSGIEFEPPHEHKGNSI